MPRISLADPQNLTPDQRRVYEKIVSGPRRQVVGPLRAVLLIPELADRWQSFGEQLRYRTSLPKRCTELAIVTVARHYNSQVEWYVHAQAAKHAGVPETAIDAIRKAESPLLVHGSDAVVYDFTRQLLSDGDVDDALHAQIVEHWGAVGVVELTAVIGYYAMVSMMLNAQAIPTPDGSEPLQAAGHTGGGALTCLPPSHTAG